MSTNDWERLQTIILELYELGAIDDLDIETYANASLVGIIEAMEIIGRMTSNGGSAPVDPNNGGTG